MNLEAEMLDKSFDQVVNEANDEWNELLSHIEVTGVPTAKRDILLYSLPLIPLACIAE